jgi:hypothetical protein
VLPGEGNWCACGPWMAEDKSKQIDRYLAGRLGEQRRSHRWGRTAGGSSAWLEDTSRRLEAAPSRKEVAPGGLAWATGGRSRGTVCWRRKSCGAGDREKKQRIVFFINRWHLRVIIPELHNWSVLKGFGVAKEVLQRNELQLQKTLWSWLLQSLGVWLLFPAPPWSFAPEPCQTRP